MVLAVALGYLSTGLATGPTLVGKVRAACAELDIAYTGLTVPAALDACKHALGLETSGPLIDQADELLTQLGLSLGPPPVARQPRDPRLPKLVVFDLDFTLWHPELYQLSCGPPFQACGDGCVLTRRGERLDLFPAARKALAELHDASVPVAIASRASERAWAEEIMRLLRVDDRRTVSDVVGGAPVVIQGGSKVHHLKHVAACSRVPLREMVFFDNERTNIQEVDKLGPTCVHCPRGLTDDVFRDGMAAHARRCAERRQEQPQQRQAGGEGAAGKDRRRRSSSRQQGKSARRSRRR